MVGTDSVIGPRMHTSPHMEAHHNEEYGVGNGGRLWEHFPGTAFCFGIMEQQNLRGTVEFSSSSLLACSFEVLLSDERDFDNLKENVCMRVQVNVQNRIHMPFHAPQKIQKGHCFLCSSVHHILLWNKEIDKVRSCVLLFLHTASISRACYGTMPWHRSKYPIGCCLSPSP